MAAWMERAIPPGSVAVGTGSGAVGGAGAVGCVVLGGDDAWRPGAPGWGALLAQVRPTDATMTRAAASHQPEPDRLCRLPGRLRLDALMSAAFN